MRAPSRRELSAALRLARWTNALTAAAGVLVGAWWAVSDLAPLAGSVALAALAAIGLTIAANSWNDLADIDIDRMAHPERPLPSFALPPAAAETIAMAAAIAAVVFASLVSVTLGVCTVVVLLLMQLYSPWLKRTGFLGNVIVAVLASLPFVYGSYAAGSWERGLPLVLIAIPLHLARELAKDLDDRDADRLSRSTLPNVVGVVPARAAILVALVAAGIALAFGVAPRVKSPLVLLAALIPAIAALGLATVRAMRGKPGSPACFKLAMACAMAALLVARA
ncbi:MAG: UbiA family prenyltransferase [Gemmatimonadota bacterium]